jgi:hypothetical protein
MSIHLRQPYKIIPSKHKRYGLHYGIPAADVVVVPLRLLGAEVSCDIRWEDSNGELHLIENAVFINDNLVPLNQMLDMKLHEIWNYYYNTMKQTEL